MGKTKRKVNPEVILARIEELEKSILHAEEYLEDGSHADDPEFRPLFCFKFRDGELVPPHPDWVRHVFLPRKRRRLAQQEKLLQRVESS